MGTKSKYVVLFSIILSTTAVVLTIAAAILPAWYTLNTGYTTYHVGPFHMCYDYGSDTKVCAKAFCSFNTMGYGPDQLVGSCALAKASAGLLLLGGIFSLFTVISMIVGQCAKARGACMVTCLPIMPLILHIFTIVFYTVTVVFVVVNAARTSTITSYPYYTYYTHSFDTSFFLTVSSAGLTGLSSVLYAIFGVCLKQRKIENELGVDLSMMNNSTPSNLQTSQITLPLMTNAPAQYGYAQLPYQQSYPAQYPPQSYPTPYPSYYPPQMQPIQPSVPQPSPYAIQYQQHQQHPVSQ